MGNIVCIYPYMRMRLTWTYSNKFTMNLNLEAHIQFQGAATSVEYSVLLFVIKFDIGDYIKIDVSVWVDRSTLQEMPPDKFDKTFQQV